jgi:hypothetical protein
MFLEAYRTKHHRVFFGAEANKLKQIAEFENDSTNIVKPPALEPGKTYYWKVEAVRTGGKTVSSPVWRFKTAGG